MGKGKTKIRVVLDTNVLISALIFGGRLSLIHTLWRDKKAIPALSRETFQEFVDALGYPKFFLSREEVAFIIEEEVLPYFEIVDIKEEIVGVCRDPDDDKFLSCAISANASHLVSGDKDLLDLKNYNTITIVSPVEFIKLFQ